MLCVVAVVCSYGEAGVLHFTTDSCLVERRTTVDVPGNNRNTLRNMLDYATEKLRVLRLVLHTTLGPIVSMYFPQVANSGLIMILINFILQQRS